MTSADLWQVAGPVVGLLGAGVTAIGYFFLRKFARFQYKVAADSAIDTGSSLHKEIEVRVNGVPVANPTLVSIVFANSGNVVLDGRDFKTPISASIEGGGMIHSVNTIKSWPSSFEPPMTFEGNSLTLEPALWNPGDAVNVSLLVYPENPAKMHIDGRVRGVSQIEPIPPDDAFAEFAAFMSALGLGLTIFMAGFLTVILLAHAVPLPEPVFLTLGFTVGILFVIAVLKATHRLGKALTPKRLRYRDLLGEEEP